MFELGSRPCRVGILRVEPRRGAAELVLRRVELARGDGQQPLVIERNAFVELELLLQALAPETKRSAGARRDLLFEILDDVRADRPRRLGGRVGEIAEDVQIVQARKARAADRPR